MSSAIHIAKETKPAINVPVRAWEAEGPTRIASWTGTEWRSTANNKVIEPICWQAADEVIDDQARAGLSAEDILGAALGAILSHQAVFESLPTTLYFGPQEWTLYRQAIRGDEPLSCHGLPLSLQEGPGIGVA